MFVRPGDGLGRIPGGLPSSGLPAPQLSDLVPLGLSSWGWLTGSVPVPARSPPSGGWGEVGASFQLYFLAFSCPGS